VTVVVVLGRRRVGLDADPRVSWLYRVGREAVRLAVALGARVQVDGRERIPNRGSLLVVANHTSVLDPVVLAAVFPRPILFMAKDELFHVPIFGRLLRGAGIIPVRRGRPDRAALQGALAVLREGGVLAVFPEGTRSADGVLRPVHAGAGLLAVRSEAPVLPIAIVGTERLSSVKNWLTRPRIAVRVGAPVRAARVAERGREYRPLAEDLMGRVAELLPPARRGPYGRAGPGAPPSSGRDPRDGG
jgi:1-acyl-sn-glycerol-3-phosphate acyltransferase